MKITEVRIFPTESKDGKLKAFATMTFDDWFVVRNVKVIQGNNGLFVAMPSRKAMDPCPKCQFKNVKGAKYCNQCGSQLPAVSMMDENTEMKQNSHMDIAHPITQDCRVYIQDSILKAYEQERSDLSGSGDAYANVSSSRLNEEVAARAEQQPAPEISREDAAKDIEL